jgi:ectoine hydroxylase-related dioxygenase (phytanoyl-CoA dioxygenase family)
MDGMSIMRPTALPEGSEDYSTRKNWLHVDSDGFAPPAPLTFGTQGVVNVSGMDGTNGLGGAFQCVPGSHLDFAEWMEAHTSIRHKGAQYTSVPKEDTMLNLRKRMVRLNVPDRSITIWKNELFHCNHPNESRRVRFAQYVNMEPAAWVADDVVIQRIQAYTEGRGTTHWVRTLNPSSGHCVDYTPPVLGDVAKKLLGMDSW